MEIILDYLSGHNIITGSLNVEVGWIKGERLNWWL